MKLYLPAMVVLTFAIAAPATAGDVKLQLGNGRVTLQARDATVREILAEWARVGGVKVVNAERVMGAPLTLDLQGVPEAQALNVLLRSVSGYMAAPKAQPAATASMYDRIVIMAAPRMAGATPTTPYTPPQPAQPQQRAFPGGMPNPPMLDDQDEPGGAPPTYPAPYPPRGVIPPQQLPPQTSPGGPQQVPTPGSLPQGSPGAVSPYVVQPAAPGAPPPVTVQPGTGAPGTVSPPQPVKKPGIGGDGGDGQ